MKSDIEKLMNGDSAFSGASREAEETLRLIAGLPAPKGLEDRVHMALRAAPRRGRVLAWREPLTRRNSWLRAAAAAAIAFAVAGGGWSVYLQVQPRQPAAKVVPLAPHPATTGGFDGASAMRTPQTLNGPVLTHAVKPHLMTSKNAKKSSASASQQPNEGKKAETQAAISPAK